MRVVRLLHAFAAAALGLGLMAAAALAQSYPTKPITMIIPWPAGGSSDLTLRALARARYRLCCPSPSQGEQPHTNVQ
jgi:tripartite-type tricarboxylate transporter receptor subunit TctC